jgi:hypothetical protein
MRSGFHKHDGAHLRFYGGLGYWLTDYVDRPQYIAGHQTAGNVHYSGRALVIGMSLGRTVAGNLAVYGEVFASITNQPSYTWWDYYSGHSAIHDGAMGLVGGGPGASYYFEALNVYISCTLAATRVFGRGSASKLGLGTSAAIGKEWWASQNWGTGVSIGLQIGVAEDEELGPSTSTVPSLLWSSTWN